MARQETLKRVELKVNVNCCEGCKKKVLKTLCIEVGLIVHGFLLGVLKTENPSISPQGHRHRRLRCRNSDKEASQARQGGRVAARRNPRSRRAEGEKKTGDSKELRREGESSDFYQGKKTTQAAMWRKILSFTPARLRSTAHGFDGGF
ncbi:hypothetical protein HPP92_025304 [Vanilla planifolia]|uniref:HMA domain-containing protein n=1 Tax=Vanilla planifolia TaxID=51239 RepID=A0A835PHS0_VANPL|nr:hypothetical protein HPP92_025304 [Vanilla planifolia]